MHSLLLLYPLALRDIKPLAISRGITKKYVDYVDHVDFSYNPQLQDNALNGKSTNKNQCLLPIQSEIIHLRYLLLHLPILPPTQTLQDTSFCVSPQYLPNVRTLSVLDSNLLEILQRESIWQ